MTANYMARLLEPYQPQLPVNELVLEVNRLYHACEARDYDTRHPEVHEQLPPIWQQLIETARANSKTKVWRILDFGCGTGFEAEQLLKNLPQGTIAQLTCYDPSLEMLELCREKISPLFPKACFYSDFQAIPASIEPYSLVATNSLLHHLPDFVATINSLLPLLAPDSIWLSGHEPSNRFYRNAECLKMYNAFLQERKWRKFLSLEKYLERLSTVLGLASDPANQTAIEAVRQGLFKKKPSGLLIERLVDLHVAHSLEEANEGRGLDFEKMQIEFAGPWNLIWVKTYSYMGSYYEANVPNKWGRLNREIADKFPNDGANFCTVWKRA
jgi:SAM-dependent methyltransferase